MDFVPDVMIWIQGEADGRKTLEFYTREFSFMLSEMDRDGYLTDETAIIVSQLHLGDLGEKGNRASANSVNANTFIARLTDLGDPRLRIANSAGLEVRNQERLEGTQLTGAHFSDQGMRDQGRKRIYAAWQQTKSNYQQPVDFGLEVSRTEFGLIGSHLWHGGTVPRDIPHTATLSPSQLGQTIDLKDGAKVYLPDFTHPTKYSSALRGRIGFTVFFRLVDVGFATIGVAPGGTGGIVKRGAIYGNGSKDVSFRISAGSPAGTHRIYMARWNGGFWEMYLLT